MTVHDDRYAHMQRARSLRSDIEALKPRVPIARLKLVHHRRLCRELECKRRELNRVLARLHAIYTGSPKLL